MKGERSAALAHPLYEATQVRRLDRHAMQALGISAYQLMEKAGEAAFDCARRHWPRLRDWLIVTGIGNNGGDGYVVARLARATGLMARVVLVGDASQIQNEAAQARRAYLREGGVELTFEGVNLPPAELIVDALFGTGLSRPLTDHALSAVAAMNAASAPRFAIDIPSGLHGDTGMPLPDAVRADCTLSFIGRKQGLYTGLARDYCGELEFASLECPEETYASERPSAYLIGDNAIAHSLPRRERSAHKGQFGHALIIGGDLGMPGAARMSCEAALRTGAGRVSLATRSAHAGVLAAALPPLMAWGTDHASDLDRLLDKADVIAIGPGLGTGRWGQAMLARVLERSRPTVLDADALNLLAQEPMQRPHWVLTPHPAEAARLLGCRTSAVQEDRYGAARALQQRYGGVCVLKGAGTLVQSDERCAVSAAGNPGMATAGMGDVLTGILSGLLSQGLTLADAAELGVELHARAADLSAAHGERGMLATDLYPHLRRLVNPVDDDE